MKTTHEISYSNSFYDSISEGASKSSHTVVPYLYSLLSPDSVVDVGCGSGEWLKAFLESGTKRIKGLDGPWINTESLAIDKSQFSVFNLANPVAFDAKFDLCISLEVAEHLPAESANRFVEFLTELSSIVVFSAAIPRQGGTNHLNEQWQTYWIKKFADRGFEAFDVIRPQFWGNKNVALHYKQNAFLFTNDNTIKKQFADSNVRMADAVHPDHYMPVTDPGNYSFRKFFGHFIPNYFSHIIKNILR